ncbi:MAG TPA: hypothetical protein VGG95_06525 [Edaphobacter sp.]|jgi:hypothetical protein
MPIPETGQVVRLEDHEDKLIVKSVNPQTQTVELVSAEDQHRSLQSVPVADLLPGEDLSAG